MKTRCLKLATVIIASCLPFAVTAAADSITVTLDPNYPSDYTFYSFTATDGSTHDEPVAPYSVTVTDADGIYHDASAYAFCYDINNDDYVGTPYTGSLVYDTDTATMEATYLVNELNLAGLDSASTSVKGAISMAIWQIMFPSSTQSDGSYLPVDPAAQSYVTAADQAVSSGAWTEADSDLYPTFIPDDTSSQRYGLILSTSTPVNILRVSRP